LGRRDGADAGEDDAVASEREASCVECALYTMKQLGVSLLIVGLLSAVLIGLPLLIGVWPPDVIHSSEHILAEQRLASGHVFQVVQYWNHSDYSTVLRVTSPDGSTETHMLDGDDSKSQRLPLFIDETNHTATVTLGVGRVRKVDWK
jgi:hypothetical protein